MLKQTYIEIQLDKLQNQAKGEKWDFTYKITKKTQVKNRRFQKNA